MRAIRGAIQLDRDDEDHLLRSTAELLSKALHANEIDTDALINVLFTATPDIRSQFPALAARELGLGDVPLMCAVEMNVRGSMPLVIRLMALVETETPRQYIQHTYLRGAVALRLDLAQ
ncbi:MAG: monofunctional chorismate mutase, gram positive type, clade 1 [Microbacteriaceae bacterium]|nr:monofunctional chorismate mutase, gram positive type, clade 1 [Microbacteriaceae bacterium]